LAPEVSDGPWAAATAADRGLEAEREGPAELGEAESTGPVVSAAANPGIANTAAPTPNATANAPTRPTYTSDEPITAPFSRMIGAMF
jgi:hypothetical protein